MIEGGLAMLAIGAAAQAIRPTHALLASLRASRGAVLVTALPDTPPPGPDPELDALCARAADALDRQP